MKNLYTLICIIFLIGNVQAQFGTAQLISLEADTASAKQYIRTADVDGDGKLDILVGSSFNNLVRFFHNQANFNFESPVVLPGSWQQLAGMETSDLNGDGKPDFLTIDLMGNKLFWHPNYDGAFPQQILISASIDVLSGRILCNDFNSDGYIDIVILSGFNALLFLNDGAGNFAAPQNILTEEDETEIYDNVAGYFNEDDFLDLALATDGFKIFLNDGLGNFTNTNEGGGFTISFLLESADYNNDGLDDILMKDHQHMIPYQNSSTGFSVVGQFSPNNEHYETLFSSDLDNDGDLDVLSEDDQTNGFFWYENIDGGSSWIRHTISVGFNFSTIFGVRAADLDGDGDNDLIRSSSNGDVAIYENQLILSAGDSEISYFTVFPNPTSHFLNISGTKNCYFDFVLYDIHGKVVLRKSNLDAESPLDVSMLKSGNYFLKIIDDQDLKIKKIIISN